MYCAPMNSLLITSLLKKQRGVPTAPGSDSLHGGCAGQSLRKRLKIRLEEKRVEAMFRRPVVQVLRQFVRHESEVASSLVL